jgi:hypothetical protein
MAKKPKPIPKMKPKRHTKNATPVRDWLVRKMFGQKWRYR